jgi:hypothetical protein
VFKEWLAENRDHRLGQIPEAHSQPFSQTTGQNDGLLHGACTLPILLESDFITAMAPSMRMPVAHGNLCTQAGANSHFSAQFGVSFFTFLTQLFACKNSPGR